MKYIEKLIVFIFAFIRMMFSKKGNLQKKKMFGDICIVADGQSFTEGSVNYIDRTMVMNFFAKNEEFFRIEPRYYCLVDAMFFQRSFMYHEVMDLYRRLGAVNWRMTIIIPAKRYNDFIRFAPALPSNIEIKTVNTTQYTGFGRHFFYNMGWAMPPATSVIIMAIFASIELGFDWISLHGADHNFFDGMKVIDGVLHIHDKHLYASQKDRMMLRTDTGNKYKVSDYVIHRGLVFKSHDILREYADSKNIGIRNKTKDSLIDSYITL